MKEEKRKCVKERKKRRGREGERGRGEGRERGTGEGDPNWKDRKKGSLFIDDIIIYVENVMKSTKSF